MCVISGGGPTQRLLEPSRVRQDFKRQDLSAVRLNGTQREDIDVHARTEERVGRHPFHVDSSGRQHVACRWNPHGRDAGPHALQSARGRRYLPAAFHLIELLKGLAV